MPQLCNSLCTRGNPWLLLEPCPGFLLQFWQRGWQGRAAVPEPLTCSTQRFASTNCVFLSLTTLLQSVRSAARCEEPPLPQAERSAVRGAPAGRVWLRGAEKLERHNQGVTPTDRVILAEGRSEASAGAPQPWGSDPVPRTGLAAGSSAASAGAPGPIPTRGSVWPRGAAGTSHPTERIWLRAAVQRAPQPQDRSRPLGSVWLRQIPPHRRSLAESSSARSSAAPRPNPPRQRCAGAGGRAAGGGRSRGNGRAGPGPSGRAGQRQPPVMGPAPGPPRHDAARQEAGRAPGSG